MERSTFIRQCGAACIGATIIGQMFQSCSPTKMISGTIADSDLVFPLNSFEFVKNEEKAFKKYVIVQNDRLQYPICVFRLEENKYSAVSLKCSHQGAELQVFGDKLQCPAHGSEFDHEGNPQNPPADTKLRTFPVLVDNHNIKLSLK